MYCRDNNSNNNNTSTIFNHDCKEDAKENALVLIMRKRPTLQIFFFCLPPLAGREIARALSVSLKKNILHAQTRFSPFFRGGNVVVINSINYSSNIRPNLLKVRFRHSGCALSQLQRRSDDTENCANMK